MNDDLDKSFEIMEASRQTQAPKPIHVRALSRITRQVHVNGPRRSVRKKSRPTQSNSMRSCINCKITLTYDQHSCPSCAVVQEETWLVSPSLDDIRYKTQFMHHNHPLIF